MRYIFAVNSRIYGRISSGQLAYPSCLHYLLALGSICRLIAFLMMPAHRALRLMGNPC